MTAHPDVVRTWATLRIGGKNLDPDFVTKHFRINPSDSHKAGDRRGNKGGIWRESQWSLTSEGEVDSTDLILHIEWLLDRVEPMRYEVNEIIRHEGIKADIFCYWEFDGVNAGIDIPSRVMPRLADLNLALGLDVYFPEAVNM